jgi:hypothetical protein
LRIEVAEHGLFDVDAWPRLRRQRDLQAAHRQRLPADQLFWRERARRRVFADDVQIGQQQITGQIGLEASGPLAHRDVAAQLQLAALHGGVEAAAGITLECVHRKALDAQRAAHRQRRGHDASLPINAAAACAALRAVGRRVCDLGTGAAPAPRGCHRPAQVVDGGAQRMDIELHWIGGRPGAASSRQDTWPPSTETWANATCHGADVAAAATASAPGRAGPDAFADAPDAMFIHFAALMLPSCRRSTTTCGSCKASCPIVNLRAATSSRASTTSRRFHATASRGFFSLPRNGCWASARRSASMLALARLTPSVGGSAAQSIFASSAARPSMRGLKYGAM